MPDPEPTFGQICVEAINLKAGRPICGPISAQTIDAMLAQHLQKTPQRAGKGSPSPFGDRKRIPPSPAIVALYSQSLGHDLDGLAFCDFYASKGWKVGKTKMVDWQAAVRTWLKRNNPPKDKSHDYTKF